MGIWGGLVGPKSGNVEKVLVFKAFLEGRGSDGYAKESLQLSGPDRWEVVGVGKPSPLGLVLEVWRVCGCIYTPGGQRPRRTVLKLWCSEKVASQVTRVYDDGNGPPELMCHMRMHERPPARIRRGLWPPGV